MPDKPTTIHEALVRAKKQIGFIGKTDRNPEQGYAFRGIDSILNNAGPVLSDLGVMVTPRHSIVSQEEVQSRGGARGYRVVIESVWTFSIKGIQEIDTSTIGTEPGDKWLQAVTLGEAIDYSDKAVNKAQTQSFKNALAQVLSIPTGEPDPDHHSPDAGGTPITTADQVLAELEAGGMAEGTAKAYAGAAMEDLELEHPIEEATIAVVVERARELYDEASEPMDGGYG